MLECGLSMQRTRLISNAGYLLLAASLHAAFAQDAAAPPPAKVKGRSETMVVLGSATPVPLAESQRSVEILPVKGMSLAAESPQDFLRQDSSVFLEERGAGGGQADMVLRGGSFEQTLVLLNGFRINDAQTSHHNLDLPVPLEAMDSIQVLEGSGSTLHGVDALSGVVDFLTAAPDHDSVFLRAGEGSFESNEETLLAGATRGSLSGRVTAERNFSTGFMTDRDYRNEDASAEGWMGSRLGVTDLLFAGSDRSFGANQFYGNYPEWERTKGWFGSMRQELGSQTVAAFGYRRHTDEFVLFATIRRSTKTIILTARGRRRCGAQKSYPPNCPLARCYSWGWRQTATVFKAIISPAASLRLRSASMRAIAARATLTWICGRRSNAGACQRARAKRFFQAARKRCFLRSWRAAFARRIV